MEGMNGNGIGGGGGRNMPPPPGFFGGGPPPGFMPPMGVNGFPGGHPSEFGGQQGMFDGRGGMPQQQQHGFRR